MPKRNRLKQTASLEERLTERARQAREDVEKLPPGEERDALIQKIREIESTLQLGQFLKSTEQSRK